MTRRHGILAVCVLAAAHAGCSVAFVRPTPRVSAAGAEPACGSVAFPLADLGGAVVVMGVSSFAAGLANSTNGYNGCESAPRLCHHASATQGYVVAGALAASAVYGFVAGAACRSEIAR